MVWRMEKTKRITMEFTGTSIYPKGPKRHPKGKQKEHKRTQKEHKRTQKEILTFIKCHKLQYKCTKYYLLGGELFKKLKNLKCRVLAAILARFIHLNVVNMITLPSSCHVEAIHFKSQNLVFLEKQKTKVPNC